MVVVPNLRTLSPLLVIGAFGPSHPCNAGRNFTVADDIAAAYFAAPIMFSPNGQYFLVDTERGLLGRDRPESTLRVYSTESVGEFLLRSKKAREPSPEWTFRKSTYKDGPIITNMRWLHDSSAIAFLAKSHEGNDELLLADVRTKTIRTLTPHTQHVTGFDVRDAQHFVYTVLSPNIIDKATAESEAVSIVGTGRPLISLLFPENLYRSTIKQHDLSELWAVEKGRRFRVENNASGRPVLLHSEGEGTLALSHDGRYLVSAIPVDNIPPEWETLYPPPLSSDVYRIHSGRQDPDAFDGGQYTYVSEYVLINLGTGQVRPLSGAPIGRAAGWWWTPAKAEWAPDGQSIMLPNTFIPSALPEVQNKPNRPCVAVVELVTDRVGCVERLNAKDNDANYNHLIASIGFVGEDSRRLTVNYYAKDDSKWTTSYARASDGSWIGAPPTSGWAEEHGTVELDVKEGLNDPPVLIATDKATATSRVILDPNPQLKDVELSEATVYKWQDTNGRNWVGGLYKPPDYVRGLRYPLVVQTHGFRESVFSPSGIYPTAFAARTLAASGIVVLQVRDCPVTIEPDEGTCNVAGYETAVRQLVEDGFVDPLRVGIVGFSRTCYYVLKTLTTSTLQLRAASITDGVNVGYLQYMISVDFLGNAIRQEADAMIGARPLGEGLQNWLKRSPEFNLDKVRTPLQIVALGRWSLNFMWEPYAALRVLNRPVDLVMLRQGTHVLTNPAERMASQGGSVDWFRFWLQGYEDPPAEKADQYRRWEKLCDMQIAENPNVPTFCVRTKH